MAASHENEERREKKKNIVKNLCVLARRVFQSDDFEEHSSILIILIIGVFQKVPTGCLTATFHTRILSASALFLSPRTFIRFRYPRRRHSYGCALIWALSLSRVSQKSINSRLSRIIVYENDEEEFVKANFGLVLPHFILFCLFLLLHILPKIQNFV